MTLEVSALFERYILAQGLWTMGALTGHGDPEVRELTSALTNFTGPPAALHLGEGISLEGIVFDTLLSPSTYQL